MRVVNAVAPGWWLAPDPERAAREHRATPRETHHHFLRPAALRPRGFPQSVPPFRVLLVCRPSRSGGRVRGQSGGSLAGFHRDRIMAGCRTIGPSPSPCACFLCGRWVEE
ncbi:hypothetical protein SEVIR_9G484225v4 [Setaria viridis]